MAAPKTTTSQQSAALRAEIYRLYCSSQSQPAIAQVLGMRQSAISYHVNKARAAHQAEIAHRRADRLAELNHLRNQCWQAWEREKTATAAVFLAHIQKAIQQERALLGLDCAKSLSASVAFGELPHDTKDFILGEPKQP